MPATTPTRRPGAKNCLPVPNSLQWLPSCHVDPTIWRNIYRACEELAPTHPEFAEVRFAPHDFRRLFATELVNNGLPIHIGAALLGHLDIRTTRGSVAVFSEDVITQYQLFLARRRAQRPPEEYREPTTAEWNDFNEHFDKRRVELGSCGRPYGTPCQHEHACFSELTGHAHPGVARTHSSAELSAFVELSDLP
ncbi:site-specific integrase [Nocardia abscessus]|uniref:site-specific integrase n=1 Tax=Nocardia abscessus TaxID=120957 RepID=UPI002457ECBD|nr:site-specific integrase [Nocardia abscessus]